MSEHQDGIADALAGRYEIRRELGRGGMATVFLARDLRHDREVALKVMHADFVATVGADRFLKEISFAASLNHPKILPLFDSGEAAGQLFYVMPFIEGDSLRSRIDEEGPLPIEDAVRIACDVCDALAYAHERGIVHRDIKPANVMLSRGTALVAYF